MNTSAFWAATGERAVKTFAQTLIALIGAGAISIVAIPWPDNLGIAATATLLSVLTSLVSSTVGNPGPSLATEVLSATVTPVSKLIVAPFPDVAPAPLPLVPVVAAPVLVTLPVPLQGPTV